jgi:hypothetical protein
MQRLPTLCALALAALMTASPSARAEDTLKVAVGQITNWENQAPTLRHP